LRLRGIADANHGLGYYGGGKTFQLFAPDGPVLYGYSGGALGTTGSGNQLALTWNSSGQVGIGTTTPSSPLQGNGPAAATAFAGSGSGLTSLAASNLTGIVADARLSTNVIFVNGTNTFTASNRFTGVLIATNVSNQLSGSFSGNGSGLSSLTAASLS